MLKYLSLAVIIQIPEEREREVRAQVCEPVRLGHDVQLERQRRGKGRESLLVWCQWLEMCQGR